MAVSDVFDFPIVLVEGHIQRLKGLFPAETLGSFSVVWVPFFEIIKFDLPFLISFL